MLKPQLIFLCEVHIMKKQVHYTILEDMQKYIPNFNPNDYEDYPDKTDQ